MPSTSSHSAAVPAVRARGVDITLDGEQIKVENPRSFRLKVSAGPHTIGLALPDRQRGAGVDEIYSDFRVDADLHEAGGVPNLVITGPFNTTGAGDTPSRRRIFTCQPKIDRRRSDLRAFDSVGAGATCVSRPGERRRVDTLMGFYQQGARGGDFESGIQQGLARILVAPRFVYRVEEEPATVASGAAVSRQRCRARVAAVVLPVEQHPGR